MKAVESTKIEVLHGNEKRKFDSAWQKLVEIVFGSIRQGYIDGYLTRDRPMANMVMQSK